MAGPNDILTKTFTAEAVIAKNTIVKLGTATDGVLPAVGNTNFLIGIATEAAAAIGDRIDVQVMGIAEVIAGGNVTKGHEMTSDANAQAVEGTGATAKQYAIGVAFDSGVAGDVIPLMIVRSQFDK